MTRINEDLRNRVLEMRDEFSTILDEESETLDGALRVKLAKAELLLNRVYLLIDYTISHQ